MEKLDQWIEEEVFENLYAIWNENQDGNLDSSPNSVKKAIKEKVLESYRNGQKAGPPKPWVRRSNPSQVVGA